MDVNNNRLILDLDPHLERRLKTTAALRGISMRQYCQAAIDRELARDEAQGVVPLAFGHESVDRLAALREATFGGETLLGDSATFIREDRATRSNPQTWSG